MKIKSLIMSLFAVVLMSFTGVAQTTYTFADYPAGTQYAVDEVHVLDNNVTLTTTQCHFTAQLRVYSSASHDGFFVSNELPYFIQSLSFNLGYKVDDVKIYGSNDGSNWTEVGTISVTSTSYADYTLDFGTNDYKRFKFDVVGTNQIRATSMTITYKQSTNMVSAPTFTPAEGLYETTQNVAISSQTEGASIRYTLDGTEPTATSTLYSTPIAVSTTTTIKAKAFKAGMDDSFVTTATYTFPTIVSNIAALRNGTADGTTVYKLASESILTFQTAHNNVKAITDATGSIIIFDANGVITTTYNLYDGISNIYGTLELYNGLLELKPYANTGAATSTNNTFVPELKTIPTLALTDEAKVIRLNNVTISDTTGTNTTFVYGYNYSITDAEGNKAIFRTSYNSMSYIGNALPTAAQNITALVTVYNSVIQLVVIDYEDANGEPTISTTPATLANFNYIVNDGPSAEQTIAVNGNYLTSNVTVTCGNSYEISTTSGTGFTNTLTIAPNGGLVQKTVYIRLKAGLTQNSYNETLNIVPGDNLQPLSINLYGTVSALTTEYSWKRITSLSELTNNSQVIIASRNNANPSQFAAMTANTTNKPDGITYNAVSYQGTYILPVEANAVDTNYIWTVTTDGSGYTFTNARNNRLGYLSATNFASDTNYVWNIYSDTSVASALVPNYIGYVIKNQTSTSRAIAINASNKFAPYATSNITSTQAGTYNFFNDFFMKVMNDVDTSVVAMPTFNPASGEYWDQVIVSIACATEGASIYYTTDGTTPTGASTLYTAPLSISQTTTVKAIAKKAGKADSNVATASYTINITPIIPAITVSATSLEGFAYSEGNGPSTAQTLDVTAINLTQNLAVNVAGDFEIAETQTGPYAQTLSLATTSGSINATLYVRMSAGLTIGTHMGAINLVADTTAAVLLSGFVSDSNAVTTTETFDNLGIGASSSYHDDSFVGVNGITWTMIQSRNDVAVTGASVMLGRNRDPQAELYSSYINGGCAQISFDYMQAFSTNVNLNVYVNDVLVGNVTSSGEANVIKSSGMFNVYVGGSFTIKFKSANNSDGQVCIDNVSWTSYNDGTQYVDVPTFTPNAGTYLDSVNVSIICGTEGATINYSTTSENGPWTVYSAPIAISQSTAIWAYAEKAGCVTSMVGSAIYDIISATDVNSIAQLRQGSADTYYRLTSEAILTFQTSYRGVKYIQDATGAIQIDDNSHVIATTYSLYDGITGLVGTVAESNSGMLQFIPLIDPGQATSHNNTVTPEVVTLSQLSEAHEAKLVTIENVSFGQSGEFAASTTYNITDPTGAGVVRTQYNDVDYIGANIPTTATNVTAVVLEYNGTMQLVPRSSADLEAYDGIAEISDSQIMIWNCNGIVYVNNGSSDALEMNIYNVLGQPVMSKMVESGMSQFSHSLNSGLYIVTIGDTTTKIMVK